jgi:SAM-dependent MidA family methyltransferase
MQTGVPPFEPSSLADLIAGENGSVTFARFMELALTHPTLGYYSRADRLLWHGGDFNTAPALSPFFNRTVARLVTELLEAGLEPGAGGRQRSVSPESDTPPSLVELGGGEGQLAAAVLAYWDQERPAWRGRVAYRTVEMGARLRERQAVALEGYVAAGWDIGWGEDLEEACAGTRPLVIVGNEFLDTIPVHMVDVTAEGLREAYVAVVPAGLEQRWGKVSKEAVTELRCLFDTLDPAVLRPLTEDGIIEVFSGLGVLLGALARAMPSGSLVNVDYGEWFPGVPHPGERWGLEGRGPRRRTVRGYFKHQMVLDVLVRPGRQDLTADVDFAALDLHGREEGFETVLFTTLARFLRGGGAESELQALRVVAGTPPPLTAKAVQASRAGEETEVAPAGHVDRLEADRQATVLENLLDESDLGGAFKLMVQVKG